jgi:hypothetical protein
MPTDLRALLSVIPSKSDQTLDPFQSETLPSAEREGRLVDLSHPAKRRQCEVPLARHDGDRRHHQRLPFSSDSRARRPEKPLAQSGLEAADAAAGDVVSLEIAPAAAEPEPGGTGRSEKSSRGRPAGAGVMVGHHARRAQRLDPLDHLRQAARDTRAPYQKCLLDARCREATRLLLRPGWVLQ